MAMKHATSKLKSFDDLYGRPTGGSNDGENGRSNVDNGRNESSDPSYSAAPTLGFRGEALFCLANLSRSLVVSTRTAEDECAEDKHDGHCVSIGVGSSGLGEQFAFNHEGHLILQSIQPLPRSIGTTITVYGLFETLPVRRVDLCKRIKGQRIKLMKMLQGCE